jgi:hypothetical protein
MQVELQKKGSKSFQNFWSLFFALNNAKDKKAPKVFKTHGAFFFI